MKTKNGGGGGGGGGKSVWEKKKKWGGKKIKKKKKKKKRWGGKKKLGENLRALGTYAFVSAPELPFKVFVSLIVFPIAIWQSHNVRRVGFKARSIFALLG
jgi:hypothetical protein